MSLTWFDHISLMAAHIAAGHRAGESQRGDNATAQMVAEQSVEDAIAILERCSEIGIRPGARLPDNIRVDQD